MLSYWKRLIDRVLFDYAICRMKKKQLAQHPRLREIDAEERAARKAHRSTRAITAERSRIVHQQLASEVGRTA